MLFDLHFFQFVAPTLRCTVEESITWLYDPSYGLGHDGTILDLPRDQLPGLESNRHTFVGCVESAAVAVSTDEHVLR